MEESTIEELISEISKESPRSVTNSDDPGPDKRNRLAMLINLVNAGHEPEVHKFLVGTAIHAGASRSSQCLLDQIRNFSTGDINVRSIGSLEHRVKKMWIAGSSQHVFPQHLSSLILCMKAEAQNALPWRAASMAFLEESGS